MCHPVYLVQWHQLYFWSAHSPGPNNRAALFKVSYSHLSVRRAQSKTPSNLASSFPCFNNSFWFCTRSLTRSIGAADVFAIAAAVPERKKFSAKPSFLLPEDILSMLRQMGYQFKFIIERGAWLQISERQNRLEVTLRCDETCVT